MSTITAILEADIDGSLHLPLPAELRLGKVKVVAELTPVGAGDAAKRNLTAASWIQRARGSVRLAPGESAETARGAYYAKKYGVEP